MIGAIIFTSPVFTNAFLGQGLAQSGSTLRNNTVQPVGDSNVPNDYLIRIVHELGRRVTALEALQGITAHGSLQSSSPVNRLGNGGGSKSASPPPTTPPTSSNPTGCGSSNKGEYCGCETTCWGTLATGPGAGEWGPDYSNKIADTIQTGGNSSDCKEGAGFKGNTFLYWCSIQKLFHVKAAQK